MTPEHFLQLKDVNGIYVGNGQLLAVYTCEFCPVGVYVDFPL